ncbi:hypothetical protein [Microbaculum marinisediminis]|uniref:Lipoprotein n=1 Tax=Microbaculum marinisediminis TaxID=2931392 RepID=A0AAW5QY10_9HYPH|nr:hypothetical protein [Microbaculum sp. A6E488]MCT8971239.1 hypothetical protein [Microbaculum sp. A6E488]
MTFGRDVRAVLSAVLLTAALAGCAAEAGDFGRPVKGYVNDVLLPDIGDRMARNRGEPVSDFMLTDDEKELRARSYRFIMPIHLDAFRARNETEWVRTRIWPDSRWRPDPTLYYRLMRKDGYQSNYGRWNSIIDEITADIPLVLPYYVVWQEVCRADQQRQAALSRTVMLTPTEDADARARVWENRRVADWAVTGMRWRVESYAYAIQRTEIEIPTGRYEAEANAVLDRLRSEVEWLATAVSDPTCGGGAIVSKSPPPYDGPMVVKR